MNLKIDWRLFPMKLHYFVRFMGTGLTVFLPVVTMQKGVPAKVVGIIWGVLPVTSMVAKTVAGAIADVTRGHRAVFLGGVCLMVTCLTALYWVPDIPNTSSSSSTNSSSETDILSSSVSTLPPFLTTSSVHEGLTSNSPSLVISSQPSVGVEEGDTSTSLPASTSDPKGGGGGGGELPTKYEFWVLFLCLLGQYCGHVVVITMQETVCFQLLGEARHKYGQQRLWGTVGIGLSAMAIGALVDWYSKGKPQKDYLPAHILTAVFLVIDIVVVARLKFPLPQKRMSSSALQGALRRPHRILVLVSTGVVGVVSGLLWTWELILAEAVAKEWNPKFDHTRLLQGLLMGVQTFLAEVPFFVLAGRIIKRLGHANALFVSLLGFMLRLVLFSIVTNPWFFLLIDLLHGISFAVAYPCITSYASSIAPKGAEATTQAIFGATFFGCTGVGGLIGGELYDAVGGRKTFLLMGVATGLYSIFFLVAHYLIGRFTRSSGQVTTGNVTNVPRITVDGESLNEDEEDVKEKKGEDAEEVKMDLIEIREQKGGDSVRPVSYRRTAEFT